MEVKAIVIKSLDYKESSKITYLYSPKGNISVMSRGAKKLKMGLLPFITTFNYVNAILTDKDFPTLIDFTLLDDFHDLKKDLKTSLWLNYLLELVYKLPADVPHEKCFSYLLNTIENIRKNINIILLVTIFQLKITYLFGVKPNFNTSGQYFSLKDGQMLNYCTKLSKEDSEIFKLLYTFNSNDYSVFDKIDFIKFFNYVNEYYSYHVYIKIKGLTSIIF